MAPKPPAFGAPGEAVALLFSLSPTHWTHGGPEMAPKPPYVRSAPAKPWRSSTPASLRDSCPMWPRASRARQASAPPRRASMSRGALRFGQSAGTDEHGAQHRARELAGERVLLARMVGRDQRHAVREGRDRPVAEHRERPRQVEPYH